MSVKVFSATQTKPIECNRDALPSFTAASSSMSSNRFAARASVLNLCASSNSARSKATERSAFGPPQMPTTFSRSAKRISSYPSFAPKNSTLQPMSMRISFSRQPDSNFHPG